MLLLTGAQVAILFLLARQMGSERYGQFVTVIAVASFVSPFLGLGLSNIVLRNGARDPAHMPSYLSHAVRWWSYTLFRSEEHTSELQSLMRISYAVFCLKKKQIK